MLERHGVVTCYVGGRASQQMGVLMTAPEFRRSLRRCGWTYAAFAERVVRSVTDIRAYASGRKPVDPWIATWLRAFMKARFPTALSVLLLVQSLVFQG